MASLALSVALVVRGRAPGIQASIEAFAEALDVVERAGHSTQAVLLDCTSGPEAATGAETIRVGPDASDLQAWTHALRGPATRSEHLLLAATDAAPAPGALLALCESAQRDRADLVLADAADPAP
jgi:hypothetical protein